MQADALQCEAMDELYQSFWGKERVKVSRREVLVGGRRVYYREAGQGYPLLLVHGLSGSARWWERNVASLAQRYHVYLVDLPGFGSMSRARGRFLLQQAANWLLQWMEATGVERAHLAGHSMGGYICMRLAVLHPEKVARLILISPAIMLRVQSISGYVMPLVAALKHTSSRFLVILGYDVLRAGPLTLLRATRDLLTQESLNDYNAIVAPTLLIWGEHDTLVPSSMGYILQQEITNARLLIIPRAGHVSMFEQSDECNRAIMKFLEEP